MKHWFLYLLSILLVSYWAIQALFTPGYFPMHDDTQIARVIVMGNALRDGQFPVRWVSDLGYGYGYPLFNFYGPLPYYFGGILYALGVSALVATKLMFGIGIVSAGITTFFLARRMLGNSGGILAAALTVYAPYHAVQVYVRGAVGEYWAVAFLPLVLAGVMYRSIIVGGIGLALVILSHTILGFITVLFYVVFFIIYWVVQYVRKRWDYAHMKRLLLMLGLGLGISAFFWLPALFEMRFTNVSGQTSATADFRDHFVCLSQLWDSPWGFGGSVKGCLDGLSYKLGKFSIILVLATIVGWFIYRKHPSWHRFFPLLVGVVLSLFFLVSLSQPIWEFMAPFAYIQYPWRFLSFVMIYMSLVAAHTVLLLPGKIFRAFIVSVCIAILLWGNAKLFQPQYVHPAASAQFEQPDDLRWRVSKISDEYLPANFVKPEVSDAIVRDFVSGIPGQSIEHQIEKSQYIKFFINIPEDSTIALNRVFFPGWHYYLNEKEVTPRVVDAIPYLSIPQGRQAVELKWFDTPIRFVANVMSLVTLGILLYVYGKKTIA